MPLNNHGERGMDAIKDNMETKGHLSRVLDLHDAHLLPGQSDPMNANYVLSPVFGLSTETVPTRPVIEFAKECTKDPHALNKLTVHRTTASYKLIHGLVKTVKDRLKNKL